AGAAPALRQQQRLPGVVADGPRNGAVVNGWPAVLSLSLAVVTGLGVYDLQRWLERWDHDRHRSD
ncbi:hypothetical protein, partial [Mycolicibacterium sp.]|uniref:hypothetical protein n=1 Tax=Mycolicibacterium sp. TaxID=2320850 RepID=UPI0037CA5247